MLAQQQYTQIDLYPEIYHQRDTAVTIDQPQPIQQNDNYDSSNQLTQINNSDIDQYDHDDHEQQQEHEDEQLKPTESSKNKLNLKGRKNNKNKYKQKYKQKDNKANNVNNRIRICIFISFFAIFVTTVLVFVVSALMDKQMESIRNHDTNNYLKIRDEAVEPRTKEALQQHQSSQHKIIQQRNNQFINQSKIGYQPIQVPTLQTQTLLSFLQQSTPKLKNPHAYPSPTRPSTTHPSQHPPICLTITKPPSPSTTKLKKSLQSSTIALKNIKIFELSDYMPEQQNEHKNKYNKYQNRQNKKKNNKNDQFNFYQFKRAVQMECVNDSVVVLVDGVLKDGVVGWVRDVFNQESVWVVGDVGKQWAGIFAFHAHMLQLIQNNDFQQTNTRYLQQNELYRQAITLSLLQLSPLHFKQHPINTLYDYNTIVPVDVSLFIQLPIQKQKTSSQIQFQLERIPYQIVQHLNQNHLVENQGIQNIQYRSQIIKMDGLENGEFGRAFDFVGRAVLGGGHMLNRWLEDERKQMIKLELDNMCVTVLVTQQNCHLLNKTIDSIIQQSYPSLHLILIYDNLPKTPQLSLTPSSIPHLTLTIVTNIVKKYAIYNILNAAHTFCNQNSIQIVMDAGQIFVGPNQLFKLGMQFMDYDVDAVYYTSLRWRDGFLRVSGEREFVRKVLGEQVGMLGYSGYLRAWRVSLIRQLQLELYQNGWNSWIEVDSLVPLQLPLIHKLPKSKQSKLPNMKQILTILVNQQPHNLARQQQKQRQEEQKMHKKQRQDMELFVDKYRNMTSDGNKSKYQGMDAKEKQQVKLSRFKNDQIIVYNSVTYPSLS